MRGWLAPLWMLGLSCPAPGIAQTVLTLPSTVASRDGDGISPGFDTLRRWQILLGPRELSAIFGRQLSELRLRRDGNLLDLRPGRARVTLTISTTTIDPRRSSAVFADNHGPSPVTVLQTVVDLPAAPPLAHRDAATWEPPDALVLTFTRAFAYSGGTLCIQIDAEPVQGAISSWWPFDRHRGAQFGRVQTIGVGCGPTAGRVTRMASVEARQLVPGGTPRFLGFADAGTVAFLGLAATDLPNPIDLGFVGAPGCVLNILPVLMIPSMAQPGLAGRPGVARVELPLPADSGFVGASLFAQWTFWNGVLTTSNALGLQLSGTPVTFDGATVEAGGTTSFPTAGRVEVGAIPVLQLRA